MNLTTADFWGCLTRDDKEFIIQLLRVSYKEYQYLTVGMLPFVDIKLIRKTVRDTAHPIARFWTNLPDSAHRRKYKSTRRRVLTHLSPDLLRQQQARNWRETMKRKS